MLRKYATALDDKKKFTAIVKDLFPEQVKHVNLLLMAYNMGIAQDIQNTSRINNTLITYTYHYGNISNAHVPFWKHEGIHAGTILDIDFRSVLPVLHSPAEKEAERVA